MRVQNSSMERIAGFIKHYFGWRNWSVLHYNSVTENVFLIFYIALRDRLYSVSFIEDFFIFIAFSMFSTTYGYLINDLADKELDALHGKDNTFKNDSVWKAGIIVVVFMVLSIIAGMKFFENRLFLPLWLCWFFIATFYSLKPIRLKERGWIGLLFVVMAQRVLPTLLVFAAFKHLDAVDMIVFTSYIFARGLSSDLNHQLEDYPKDITTGTETFAMQTGLRKVENALRFTLETEKIFLFPCLIITYCELKHLHLYNIPLLLPLLIGYIILYGLSLKRRNSLVRLQDINPFIAGRKDIFQFIHHAFPSVLLPFYLLLILLYEARGLGFAMIAILFIIYRKLYSVDLIKNSFLVKSIDNSIKRI